MKLEEIGFYTLSDSRALTATHETPLMRCELVLTDACNFRCAYCRGLPADCAGTMRLDRAKEIVSMWASEGLKNIRFSGGEPAFYRGIVELVAYACELGIDRIAVSTNGSAPLGKYLELIDAGVNDFSISLDACCAAEGDQMAGGIPGSWETVVSNIKALSKLVYTTVGVVLTDANASRVGDIVAYADSLGVADIRVIPAAQMSKELASTIKVDARMLEKHPILAYRIGNAVAGNPVRGINDGDAQRCRLVLDDMAAAGDYHYPCIIYLREQGPPIGRLYNIRTARDERRVWSETHDCGADPICKANCLDVCVDYNNRASSRCK